MYIGDRECVSIKYNVKQNFLQISDPFVLFTSMSRFSVNSIHGAEWGRTFRVFFSAFPD